MSVDLSRVVRTTLEPQSRLREAVFDAKSVKNGHFLPKNAQNQAVVLTGWLTGCFR
jgi:hypothetical protein